MQAAKKTVIPNGVASIGDYAFYNCSGLTSITIPNSVTSIGSSAFSGCSGLTIINIPSSVTSIGGGAFSGCSGLTTIYVDSGNTKYDSRNKCNAIIEKSTNILIAGCKNTVIPSSVTSIGNSAFSRCSSLTSITIPSSVTSIGNSAFSRCSSLTSITIPSSVTSIGGGAFEYCISLTSITIANSVTSIGNESFRGCSGLTSVTVENPTPVTIDQYTFSNRANATLYVPYGSKAAYEAANFWKEFNIIEMGNTSNPFIIFADVNVKAICVANWDTNGDGELSEAEAAAVTDLGTVFREKNNIPDFITFCAIK